MEMKSLQGWVFQCVFFHNKNFSSLSKITSECVCKPSSHFKAVTVEICSDKCFYHSLGISFSTGRTVSYNVQGIFHFPSSKSPSQ